LPRLPNLVSVGDAKQAANLGTYHVSNCDDQANNISNQAPFPSSIAFPDRQAILEPIGQSNGRSFAAPIDGAHSDPKRSAIVDAILDPIGQSNGHSFGLPIVGAKHFAIVEAEPCTIPASIDGAHSITNTSSNYRTILGSFGTAIAFANRCA